MPLDIQPSDLKELQMILKKYASNCKIFAFGSRVKGSARKNSDLDLCIKGKEALSLEKLGLLRDALSESNIPYKVDVIDWHTISESFQKIIEKNKVTII